MDELNRYVEANGREPTEVLKLIRQYRIPPERAMLVVAGIPVLARAVANDCELCAEWHGIVQKSLESASYSHILWMASRLECKFYCQRAHATAVAAGRVDVIGWMASEPAVVVGDYEGPANYLISETLTLPMLRWMCESLGAVYGAQWMYGDGGFGLCRLVENDVNGQTRMVLSRWLLERYPPPSEVYEMYGAEMFEWALDSHNLGDIDLLKAAGMPKQIAVKGTPFDSAKLDNVIDVFKLDAEDMSQYFVEVCMNHPKNAMMLMRRYGPSILGGGRESLWAHRYRGKRAEEVDNMLYMLYEDGRIAPPKAPANPDGDQMNLVGASIGYRAARARVHAARDAAHNNIKRAPRTTAPVDRETA